MQAEKKNNLLKGMALKFGIAALLYFVMPCILMQNAAADFVVRSEYQSREPFGNAETVCFHDAITGRPLSPEEERSLEVILPFSEVGRYYGRVRANASTLTLDQIRNKSLDSINSTRFVLTNSRSRSQAGLELAIGYIYDKDFRFDLEYLVNRNFTFTSNQILAGSPVQSLELDIKSNPLLANFYWDFTGFGFNFDRFRPYVVGALGASLNSVRTTLITNPSPPPTLQSSKRLISFAWGVGVGFRVSMFTRWFFDVSYRYIRLGTNVRFQPSDDTFRLNGNYSMSAISFGFIYLF